MIPRSSPSLRLLLLLLVGALFTFAYLASVQAAPPTVGPYSITAYAQDFNTLASSGTSSTVTEGWAFIETGTNANLLYTAGNGSSNSGDTYSFGSTGSTDRAFGGLLSGSLNPTIGAQFQNLGTAPLATLTISYTGEQWRLGTTGRADRLDFQYSLDATSLTTGTWTDFDALDFSSPTTTGPTGALDGNAAANRTAVSSAITGLSIPAGGIVWIRWTDSNASGADDGLAVDDFAISEDVGPPSQATPTPTATSVGPTATPTATATPTPPPSCGGQVTLISAIQGSGTSAALTGTQTVRAIVTGDFQSGGLNGYFLQEEDADSDGDPLTSEGIWVFNGSTPAVDVNVGDEVQITGNVEEFGTAPTTLTELNITASGSSVILCSNGNALPAISPVDLPLSAVTDFERYEGMRVAFVDTMTVTSNFQHERFGEVELSEGGRLYQPTHLVEPGAPANTLQAQNNLRRIILDDGLNTQNPWPIVHPAGNLSNSNTLRGGDTTDALTGFLDQRFASATSPGYRVQPNGPGVSIPFTQVNPRPPTVPAVGGTLRVASFNVLNFFTTIDVGTTGCGPSATLECRGADSADEYQRQLDKLVTAINGLNADVVGLMEIENTSAANLDNLVAALNAAAGAGTWTYINTGTIGDDAIRVAILYKPASATPFGTFAVDTDPIHDRPPLAQQFEAANGAVFTLTVVHFKSKGSCPAAGDPNADQGDGQGCWNLKRTQQAQRLLTWLSGLGLDPDRILMGDFNSYAKEDPIDVFISAGYTDLINSFHGPTAYGYSFSGQWGYLDYALASAAIFPQVVGANDWHINSDEQIDFDYNNNVQEGDELCPRDCNNEALYAVSPYRTSDHDPVIVGLALVGPTPTPTATVPATATATATATVPPTATATATATVPATATATVTPTQPPTSIELGQISAQHGSPTAGWMLLLGGVVLAAAGLVRRRRA